MAGVSRALGPAKGRAEAAGYARVRYAAPAIAELPRSLLFGALLGFKSASTTEARMQWLVT